MASPTPHAAIPETFAQALRRLLDEQEVSVRELARRLAGTKEKKAVDAKRRLIARWLSGETPNPTRPSRRQVAAALELELDYFLKASKPADALSARVDALESQVNEIESALEGLGSQIRQLLGEPRGRQGAGR